MAQRAIVNKNLQAIEILFPEHKQHFQFISQQEIPQTESKEQKVARLNRELEQKKRKLYRWVETTTEYVNEIHKYINKSDANAARFVEYVISSRGKQQRFPYKDFIQKQQQSSPVPYVEQIKIKKIRLLIAKIKKIMDTINEKGITLNPASFKSYIINLKQQIKPTSIKAERTSQRIRKRKPEQVQSTPRKTIKLQLSSMPRGQSGTFSHIIKSGKYSDSSKKY